MKNIRGFRLAAAPFMAIALGSILAGGCSDAKDLASGGSCTADLKAKADAFGASVEALQTVSVKMQGDLYVACAKIATDLKAADAPDPTKASPTSDDTEAACKLAATAIGTAKAKVTGSLELVYVAPKCEVAAEAQLSCEGKCDVNASCEGGTVEARCTPAELSGTCEGTCSGTVTCEGSASAAANCEGTCEASCKGTCDGNCDGKCDGSTSDGAACKGTCEGTCTGTCKGTCTGKCEFAAKATAKCESTASCKGGCSVAYKEPKCEAELTPPSCQMDADCQAACKGSAQFKATCTEPKVSVVAKGNAELQTTLEANLPVVLRVVEQAGLAAKVSTEVGAGAGKLVVALKGAPACGLSLGADFAAKMSASVQAAASIDVSVSASASVSVSASSK